MFSLIAPYVIRWLEQKRLTEESGEDSSEFLRLIHELSFSYIELINEFRVIDAEKAYRSHE